MVISILVAMLLIQLKSVRFHSLPKLYFRKYTFAVVQKLSVHFILILLNSDRLCVVALTRITPKDGRGHNSHIVYSYLYRHAKSVTDHIEKLRTEQVLTCDNTAATLVCVIIGVHCLEYANQKLRVSFISIFVP